ncbi:MAG TPA: LysM peptidoglycan-binding domain-containing protein [Puia sp.]|nr:LysM peptidoglycan-binding domain-containing protein [Puia sp.]
MSDVNLKIMAYKTPEGSRENGKIGEFSVMFNPATFTIETKIDYKQPDAKGQNGGDPVFEKIPPLEFSVEFVIDGTGVGPGNAGQGDSDFVKNKVKDFRELTGCNINGEIHRPNYLSVLWGTFYIECVLVSLSVNYYLFDPQGSPLRAKLTCAFLERIGAGKDGRRSRLESPDLTKVYSIKEGNTLDLIADNYYDDPSWYLAIAKANKLKNFRKLVPGTRLVLPPLSDDHARK